MEESGQLRLIHVVSLDTLKDLAEPAGAMVRPRCERCVEGAGRLFCRWNDFALVDVLMKQSLSSKDVRP